MLQEGVHLFESTKEFFDAEVFVLCDAEEVFKHLCLLVQVLTLVLIEVGLVHVLDAQVALHFGNTGL